MKRLIVFLSIITFSFVALAQQEKDIATLTDTVQGNCNMCKKRIEEAAYVKGVKRAEWNKENHVLTVVYRPSKTSDDAILKSVAKAGHTSGKAQATEADYNKLPECCHYKTNTCEH